MQNCEIGILHDFDWFVVDVHLYEITLMICNCFGELYYNWMDLEQGVGKNISIFLELILDLEITDDFL